MITSIRIFLAFSVLIGVTSCSKTSSDGRQDYTQFSNTGDKATSEQADAIVFKASGDISSALSDFRNLLGDLNTAPGAVGGRREINWDGVPAALTNNTLFPGDFFGATDPLLPNGRKRGLINSTPGSGFSISDSSFSFINPSYAGQFQSFSPLKTFVAAGSTVIHNHFKVPGTNSDASVQGFGVVFSGVNNATSTSLEFYEGQTLLGSFKVPNNGNDGRRTFSFLGVYFSNHKVTRVTINCGSSPLFMNTDDLTDGGGEDLVVMDDFIYSEPSVN
jgi:hypothetical protein